MQTTGNRHIMATSDDDAEYEEDDDIFTRLPIVDVQVNKNNTRLRVSEAGIENHEYNDGANFTDDERETLIEQQPLNSRSYRDTSTENDEIDDGEEVGAVKIQPRCSDDDHEIAESLSDDEIDDDSDVSMADDDDSKDSTEVEAEDQWTPAPEEEDDVINPNCCIFCHQDEEHDPSEEFELYLACGVCGDNAHQQCARNVNALQLEDGDNWYCPECLSNNLVPDHSAPQVLDSAQRTISGQRMTYDLSPNNQEISISKSILEPNQVNISDDPTEECSRLLRKRKNSLTIADPQDSKNPRRRRFKDKYQSPCHDLALVSDDQPHESDENDGYESDTQRKSLPGDARSKISEDKTSKLQAPSHFEVNCSSLVQKYARIVEKTSMSYKIAIKVDPAELERRLSQVPKPKKKKSSNITTLSSIKASNFVPSTLPQSFYSLHDREVDEFKSKPYGGILTEEQADTTITLPKPEHRRQFDEARQKAEEEWKARVAAASEAAAASGIKKSRKISGPASQIEYIEFGDFQIDIWYAAPYPEEYSRNKALFICEFCLKYMESDIVAWRHTTKCPWKNPPGDEIYRDGQVAVFEVDGRKNPLYCQNLCLLAKLFLGSKTLYYDVEPFLFYVMTEYDQYGCHFVGYFSKEKRPSSQNNVSCILVLPIHQRKGYGHLLIDFSYLLTRVEKKTGSPEKPLSDMGLVSYRSYWRLVICTYLKDFNPGDKIPSIRQISNDMGLTPDDVISALDALGALIRDPITGTYAIKIKPDYYREVVQRHESKNYVKLNPKALFWTPYIMGRGNMPSFDNISFNQLGTEEDDHCDKEHLESSPSQCNKRDDPFRGANNQADDKPAGSQETLDVNKSSKPPQSYYEAAASIPPTRFDVFPPLPRTRGRGSSRGSSRGRSAYSTSSRPTAPRYGESSQCSPSTRGRGPRRGSGPGRGAKRWSRENRDAELDSQLDSQDQQGNTY